MTANFIDDQIMEPDRIRNFVVPHTLEHGVVEMWIAENASPKEASARLVDRAKNRILSTFLVTSQTARRPIWKGLMDHLSRRHHHALLNRVREGDATDYNGIHSVSPFVVYATNPADWSLSMVAGKYGMVHKCPFQCQWCPCLSIERCSGTCILPFGHNGLCQCVYCASQPDDADSLRTMQENLAKQVADVAAYMFHLREVMKTENAYKARLLVASEGRVGKSTPLYCFFPIIWMLKATICSDIMRFGNHGIDPRIHRTPRSYLGKGIRKGFHCHGKTSRCTLKVCLMIAVLFNVSV